MTALSFVVLSADAAPAQTIARPAAPSSALFPLDHFWTLALDAPFAAPPAVDGGRVFVALQTGSVTAFEPGSSEPIWTRELAVEGAPVAAGGRLFVPASGMIHALDAASGSVAWRLPVAGKLAAPLTHRAGWLLVGAEDGSLQAVRASDGSVMWAANLQSPLATAPSIDGNQVAVALADSRLILMDLATGKAKWPRSLGSPAVALTLAGDRIYCGTADGWFLSIKTRDGDADWRWPLGARLAGPPAVDAERVYAVAADNVVRGFRRSSGNERWRYPIPTRALDGPVVVDGLVIVTTAAVGAPGLTYITAATGAAAGTTPALEKKDDAVRVQFPVALSGGEKPFAVLATATTAADWQLHAYRQTFLVATTEPFSWGKLYEVRRRLDIGVGVIVWGEPRTLVPLVPLVPRVP